MKLLKETKDSETTKKLGIDKGTLYKRQKFRAKNGTKKKRKIKDKEKIIFFYNGSNSLR